MLFGFRRQDGDTDVEFGAFKENEEMRKFFSEFDSYIHEIQDDIEDSIDQIESDVNRKEIKKTI